MEQNEAELHIILRALNSASEVETVADGALENMELYNKITEEIKAEKIKSKDDLKTILTQREIECVYYALTDSKNITEKLIDFFQKDMEENDIMYRIFGSKPHNRKWTDQARAHHYDLTGEWHEVEKVDEKNEN